MADQSDLVLDKAGRIRRDAPAGAIGIKTLLVHILDDEANAALLEPSIALARSFSAHLSCVHVTPAQAYVAFDKFGGVFVMNEVIRKIDEGNAALRLRVEQRLAKESIDWDYAQVTADVASALVERAALADLMVIARDPPRHDYVGPTVGFIGDILLHSRTPLLIASIDQAVIDPAGTAIVAWDGSIEAANAVRATLPLLRMARVVRIFTVNERHDDRFKPFTNAKVLDFLSRHGIRAKVTSAPAPVDDEGPDAVKAQIVEEALGANAQYIVMGGYSHTRLSEFLFGGVTRNMLDECPMAVVMAR